MSALLGTLLDALQLKPPEALERGCPLVQRPQRVGVNPAQRPATISPSPHQPDVTKNPEMLRDRRLPTRQRVNDFAHGPLSQRQIVEDLPTAGLCDRVERIG